MGLQVPSRMGTKIQKKDCRSRKPLRQQNTCLFEIAVMKLREFEKADEITRMICLIGDNDERKNRI
jgi:hypothetical protein